MRTLRTPADLVRRFAALRARDRQEDMARDRDGEPARRDGFTRQSFRLPRQEATQMTRDWFERFPKAAYRTEVERWQVLNDGSVEFTLRRLSESEPALRGEGAEAGQGAASS